MKTPPSKSVQSSSWAKRNLHLLKSPATKNGHMPSSDRLRLKPTGEIRGKHTLKQTKGHDSRAFPPSHVSRQKASTPPTPPASTESPMLPKQGSLSAGAGWCALGVARRRSNRSGDPASPKPNKKGPQVKDLHILHVLLIFFVCKSCDIYIYIHTYICIYLLSLTSVEATQKGDSLKRRFLY